MLSKVFTTSFLVVALLAGCSQPPSRDFPAAMETASYRLDFGETNTELTMTIAWEAGDALVSSSVLGEVLGNFPPANREAQVRMDGTTGQVEHIRSATASIEPVDVWRQGPQFGGVLLRRAPDALELWPPPAWWTTTPEEGTQTFGEVSASWAVDGGRKELVWTTPCLYACGLFSQDEQLKNVTSLTMRLTGNTTNWLPDWFEMSAPGVGAIVATLLTHERQGIAQLEEMKIETPDPLSEGKVAFCGYSLCEPPGWPENRSFQRGLALLQASPQWQQWVLDGRALMPTRLSLSLGYLEDVSSGVRADFLEWAFEFQKEGQSSIDLFLVRAPVTPVGTIVALVNHLPTFHDSPREFFDAGWATQLGSLDTAHASLVEAGLESDDVLTIRIEPRSSHPRDALRYVLVAGGDGCQAWVASLATEDFVFHFTCGG